MGQRDIYDIVDDLRDCGIERVEIKDLSAYVDMSIRGFVLSFAGKKSEWETKNNEAYKTVTVTYAEKGITYRMYVGTYEKMKEIAEFVGLEYDEEQ